MLVIFSFLIFISLVGVKCYFTVVLMYSSLITIEYEHLLPCYLAVRLYYFCSFMMISKGRRDVNTEVCHLSPLSVKAFLPQWLRGQPFRAIYPFRACLSCREPLCPRSQPSKGSHIQ